MTDSAAESGSVSESLSGNATLPPAKPCSACWYGETPKTPVADCPCCENSHYDGHRNLDGTPQ